MHCTEAFLNLWRLWALLGKAGNRSAAGVGLLGPKLLAAREVPCETVVGGRGPVVLGENQEGGVAHSGVKPPTAGDIRKRLRRLRYHARWFGVFDEQAAEYGCGSDVLT